MVDLAIGTADHNDVSAGLPALLGLQMVLARRQNLTSHSEGERNLQSKLRTRTDWDCPGRRRECSWEVQDVFGCVFHVPSCEKLSDSGAWLNLVSYGCF